MTKNKQSKAAMNSIMLVLVVLLSVTPLWLVKDGEFSGADGQAEVAITEIDGSYTPWFSPLLEPASGEIESLLFALQAAVGAGVIAYGFGYLQGRSKKLEKGLGHVVD